ncbi:MAG: type II secretion system F family protein [Candidatus Brocadiia bacterium]
MSESSWQIILWSLAAGVSIGCVGYVLASAVLATRDETRRLRAMGRPATSLLFKLLRPVARWVAFYAGGISARIEMAFGRTAEKSYLVRPRIWAEKRLRSAAYPEGVTADEMLGLVALGGLVGLLFGLGLNLRVKFGLIVLFTLAMGLYLPLLWVRGRIRQRQDEIRRNLPYALDLLTLSVEAGLDFTQAMTRIVKKLGNSALAAELGQTVRDIHLGRTRVQALRELSHRVDLTELNSLVGALIQADELGSSLGPILRIQADQLRVRRSQAAEKLAMEAPVKILLPLILFIFPTIFIMIFGPIALKLLH